VKPAGIATSLYARVHSRTPVSAKITNSINSPPHLTIERPEVDFGCGTLPRTNELVTAEHVMTAEHTRPLSVLIVEDLDDAAQSTAELLALCGHTVRVATCGAEALRAASEETPDVVLLDIGLPDMDGWEVADRMRARAIRKQPVVIAITGCGTQRDRYRSVDAGVDLHLIKPADPVALTGLLARVREDLAAHQSPAS